MDRHAKVSGTDKYIAKAMTLNLAQKEGAKIKSMSTVRTKWFWLRAVVRSRHFAMCFVMGITCFALLVMVQRTNIVNIVEDGQTQYIITTAQTPEEILTQEGVGFRPEDGIEFTGFEGKYGEISVERAVPITVTADGLTKEVYVLHDTVAEVLVEEGITLNEPDMVNLDLHSDLNEGDQIVVQRVNYDTRVVLEEVPNERVVKPSALLLVGTTKVTQPGKLGAKEVVYTDTYIDGQLTETALDTETLTEAPVDEVVMTGVKESTSPIEPWDHLEFDETGRPANYTKVLTSQSATAYSAKPGAGTASGRKAAVGYVAVNPNIIPYGTKLYVETVDGSYVYGYAIAADTGTALMDGRSDIDLFFSSYEESCWFGRRNVNVYILP